MDRTQKYVKDRCGGVRRWDSGGWMEVFMVDGGGGGGRTVVGWPEPRSR